MMTCDDYDSDIVIMMTMIIIQRASSHNTATFPTKRRL